MAGIGGVIDSAGGVCSNHAMNQAPVTLAPSSELLVVKPTQPPGPRTGKALLAAVRPYAREQRGRTWFHTITTFGLVFALLIGAALVPLWPLQLALSLVGAGVMVRAFIIYHDFEHGAIFRGSRVMSFVLRVFGLLFLTPPRHWRRAHNFHHAHVGAVEGSHIGSYPLMTVEMYRKATRAERLKYHVARHPLTYLLAYITVFFYSNALEPFLISPRKAWQNGLAILLHGGLIAGIWVAGGFMTVFFAFLLPYAVAAAVGAYLFYAQHNFPGMIVLDPGEWSATEAALKSSSCMRLNPVLDWMTGSIGYHHIHHLNAAIPFYRLKEAMREIPELQNPVTTDLAPWSIWRCLRLKLWDDHAGCMRTFREARRLEAA